MRAVHRPSHSAPAPLHPQRESTDKVQLPVPGKGGSHAPNFYFTRLGIVVPALRPLGAVAAGAGSSESATAAGPSACSIKVNQAAGGVELQALVSTRRDMSGSYRLSVAKSGGGGSARHQPVGGFDVRGGAPARRFRREPSAATMNTPRVCR